MLRITTTSNNDIDIEPNTSVSLEFNNPAFYSVGALQKTYSYPFTLPRSDGNKLAFSFAEQITNISALPPINANLFYNGVPLLQGQLNVITTSSKKYETSFDENRNVSWLTDKLNNTKTLPRLFNPQPYTYFYPKMRFDKTRTGASLVNNGGTIDYDYPAFQIKSVIENFLPAGWELLWELDADWTDLYLLCNRNFTAIPILFYPTPVFADITARDLLNGLALTANAVVIINSQTQTLQIIHAKDGWPKGLVVIAEDAPDWDKKPFESTDNSVQYSNYDALISSLESQQTQDDYRAFYSAATVRPNMSDLTLYPLPTHPTDNCPHYAGEVNPYIETPWPYTPIVFKTGAATASSTSTGGISLQAPYLYTNYYANSPTQRAQVLVTKTLYLSATDLLNLPKNWLRRWRIGDTDYILKRVRVSVNSRQISPAAAELLPLLS